MIDNKKIVIVLPAFNAEKTLELTYKEIPFDIVDDIILVDDASKDQTLAEAQKLKISHILTHDRNLGYGGNQKTCYNKAIEIGGDIIVMLHPDYQYTPKLLRSMCYLLADGAFDVVIGSRILGKGAIKGGMPIYKYIANRSLTFIQNILMNQKLSEYHTGYRAFTINVLKSINYNENSDNFIFDNQMIAQVFYANFEIAEITCPTKYFKEASSINFWQSLHYGFGVLWVSLCYFFQKSGLATYKIFNRPIS